MSCCRSKEGATAGIGLRREPCPLPCALSSAPLSVPAFAQPDFRDLPTGGAGLEVHGPYAHIVRGGAPSAATREVAFAHVSPCSPPPTNARSRLTECAHIPHIRPILLFSFPHPPIPPRFCQPPLAELGGANADCGSAFSRSFLRPPPAKGDDRSTRYRHTLRRSPVRGVALATRTEHGRTTRSSARPWLPTERTTLKSSSSSRMWK